MSHGTLAAWNPSCPFQHVERECCFDTERRLDIAVGYVRTARLLAIGISRQSIGAGSRSSAYLSELACATFAFQLCYVSEAPKQRRVTVNGGQLLLAYVACRERHEPAREDFSGVRDEHEAF